MGELRGALLGAGSIAVYHLRAWSAIPEVRIIALANRTRERAVALGRAFGIPESHIYADYRELLAREDLDFVDIATAPHVHREQVLAAAERGLHVLCQKPLALSLGEALEMAKACAAAGVRCVVNENWRWRRWYRRIKGWIEEGRIGRPYYAAFRYHTDAVLPRADGELPELLIRQAYTRDMPRLILCEWGIHLIDVMRFLLGDVRQVYARMGRVSPLVQGEDLAMVMLEFEGGPFGLIDISWGSWVAPEEKLERGRVEPFWVEGDEGAIRLDPYREDVLLLITREGVQHLPARGGLSPAEAYQESFTACQRHFVQCLLEGKPAETEIWDNLKTMAVMEAAYLSAEQGKSVSVPALLVEMEGCSER
jgi:predicted dehydrogenase